ncbi:MAG: TlpA family protein disulfide reductase, partial [Actinomycetota bacterium]|nr:TlpA family protein disulfide reductase [Actinomycetota bacterium]
PLPSDPPDDGRGQVLDNVSPVRVNKRLLFGSLAVAVALVVAVGAFAANRGDSVTLTSENDLAPSIGTNAALTGRSFPEVDVQTVTGDAFSTADLIGRPLIINFWYSTCAPCKRELPAFAATHAKFGDEVRFVGVDASDLDKQSEEAFARDKGVRYELLYDPDGELTTAIRVANFPQTLFVDARGTIVEQTGELTIDKLEELIRTKLL